MDRYGPRVVIEMGVGGMAAGLLLAPLVHQPWHLYATLGVLVGGGANAWAIPVNRSSSPTGSCVGAVWP